MSVTAARALATLKGFTLVVAAPGLFHLIDNATRLPELNLKNSTTYFTLDDVTEFLPPLHDRKS